jgi:hypothetical protein
MISFQQTKILMYFKIKKTNASLLYAKDNNLQDRGKEKPE